MPRDDSVLALVRRPTRIEGPYSRGPPGNLLSSAENAKLILERVLPSSRPVQIELPEVVGSAELLEAEQRIARAIDEGRIAQEARTMRAWAKTAYRSRRVARADMGLR